MSVCLPVCLSVCLSVYLPFYLCVCLSVCLSACLSVGMSSVCLSACLPVRLSTCQRGREARSNAQTLLCFNDIVANIVGFICNNVFGQATLVIC